MDAPRPTPGRWRWLRSRCSRRPGTAHSPLPSSLDEASGEELYQAACANCHGPDGRGFDRPLVAFAEELPDSTDCNFAARELDADWVAVAPEGGPVRGFSEMMPAFRGALSPEQLFRVMGYIRTLCPDPAVVQIRNRAGHKFPTAYPSRSSVELWFQPIGYRWAHNLAEYESEETERFVHYSESMAEASAIRVADATAVVR